MTASVFEMEASNTSGADFESPPPGSHVAVCVAIVDLGTHEGSYQGSPREDRQVLIAWELAHEKQTDGQPFVVGNVYNVMPKPGRKSGVRKMLEGWRGAPYNDGDKIDLRSLINRSCLLNLVEKTSAKDSAKKYIKIENVVPVPRGTVVPKPTYPPFLWSDLADPFEGPDWLPFIWGKTIPDFIEESMEARGVPVANRSATKPSTNGQGHEETSDDIPF